MYSCYHLALYIHSNPHIVIRYNLYPVFECIVNLWSLQYSVSTAIIERDCQKNYVCAFHCGLCNSWSITQTL